MCIRMKMKTPTVQQPQVTARELLPSTESNTPEEPIFGGNAGANKEKKGRSALTIKLNKQNSENSPYNPSQRILNY